MSSTAPRWAPAALAAALVGGTALAALAADHPQLTRDGGLNTVAPADGARVGDSFLLAWRPGTHASMQFAILVDHNPPPPGYLISPGATSLLVTGTALRLTIGPRTGGSPSARHWHEIVIVPVDANGYRVGESAAVVHVRDSA